MELMMVDCRLQKNQCSLWENPKTLIVFDNYCFHLLSIFISSLFQGEKKLNKWESKFFLKALSNYKRLFELILDVLSKNKIINIDDNYLYKAENFEFYLNYTLDRTSSIFLKYRGIFEFIDKCIGSYDNLMNGKQNATHLLFPSGDNTYIEGFLRCRTEKYSNDAGFPSIVANYIQNMYNVKNVLEVGAGSGLLTWPLLRQLKEFPENYLFTDISRGYLLDAQAKSRKMNYSFMSFNTIDLNRPVLLSNNDIFDAAIAYNVIHATTDVKKSIQHISNVLVPNGYFFLLELYQPYLWQHLTWGILDGWWSFEDNYRKNIPTLSVAEWKKILVSTGFEVEEIFPKKHFLSRNDTALFVAKKL